MKNIPNWECCRTPGGTFEWSRDMKGVQCRIRSVGINPIQYCAYADPKYVGTFTSLDKAIKAAEDQATQLNPQRQLRRHVSHSK